MKLTEQEQAAVSRGMIEGLLRTLHAEGVLPPERLELVLELLCAGRGHAARGRLLPRFHLAGGPEKLAGESAAIFFRVHQPPAGLGACGGLCGRGSVRHLVRPTCLSAHAGSGSRREN